MERKGQLREAIRAVREDTFSLGGEPGALQPYADKRDFTLTPEPPAKPAGGALQPPDPAPQPPGPALLLAGPFPRFVVQEHHARRLHWDLRLEADGVLRSWAVPKGIPARPGEKRLAVQVEDHPLDYMGFQGTIPPGSYGAGEVVIWDRGYYAPSVMTEGKVTFAAMGDRLTGAYKLVQTEGRNWLLIMLADGRADLGRSPKAGGPAGGNRDRPAGGPGR